MRYRWQSIVLENWANFDLHLLSSLETKDIHIQVLCNTRSHLDKSAISKESGQYGTHKQ